MNHAPFAQASPNQTPQTQAPQVQDALAQLRDIHLPAPVGWWPPAPGWWVLGAVALALLALGLYLLVRRHKQRRYRRIALSELQALWPLRENAPLYLQNLNRLLKQTALAAYPRRDIAALSGAEWLRFLDSALKRPQFAAPDTAALAEPYRALPPQFAPEALQRAAGHWIRRHRC